MCIVSYAYVVILNTYRNTLEYNLSIISVVLIMLYLQIIFHNRNTEMTRITAVNSLKRTVLILLIGKCIEYSVQCISSIDKSSPILLYLGVEQSVVYTGMVLYSLGYSDMSAYWRVLLSTSAVYCIKLFMCCNFNKIE
ncbi:hypothetical protein NEIRO03_0994 [Nematocida sp. AWRm78]|nr:hypothetical protein NEIRO02_0995 [Nematocida sp. AWRm79]KAI5183397.1 hypothetical protein NEIRO03_0994 [Nematocida sp. AWRm78]